MQKAVNRFIEDHISLIDSETQDAWTQLYDELHIGLTGTFTKTMYEAGIDPLQYLDYIPEGYLRGMSCQDIDFSITKPIRYVGANAFFSADINAIEFPEGLETIDTCAFEQATLIQIVLPRSLKFIDAWAFSDCKLLKKIYYMGTRHEWQSKVLKRSSWDENSDSIRIICIDGEIIQE